MLWNIFRNFVLANQRRVPLCERQALFASYEPLRYIVLANQRRAPLYERQALFLLVATLCKSGKPSGFVRAAALIVHQKKVSMFSSKENVNILTAMLVKYGVEHVVVCPGSRNAPLVHNFNECTDITCHPVTDERSAGFVALGLRQHTQSPVAVCVTSGSALLNVLPAAAEATYQQQGIIVISADRPQQWIGQLDGQTMPQQDALGSFVAKSVTLPESDEWYCRRLIEEAMLECLGPGRPSVHINVPISEPLFEFTTAELPDVQTVLRGQWNNDNHKEYVIRKLAEAKRPMIVLGQLPEYALPDDYLSNIERVVTILYEPIATGNLPQSFTDEMLCAIEKHLQRYKPDCVLYMGGNTVSKRLRQFLRSLGDNCYQMTISPDGTLHDVSQHTNLIIQGNPYEIISDINGYLNRTARPSAFRKLWGKLRDEVKARHEAFLPPYSNMLAVKMFEGRVQEGTFYYANSSAVRLASSFAKHYVHCNRGLNGIEGSLSVAVGASMALPDERVYCVIGDLSFFYDENALWQQNLSGNLRIMLLNNGQGGIFRNLKGLEESPVADTYVSGKHNVTSEGICRQFNISYLKATDEDSLRRGIDALISQKSARPVLLEVQTDVNIDEQVWREYYQFIARPELALLQSVTTKRIHNS